MRPRAGKFPGTRTPPLSPQGKPRIQPRPWGAHKALRSRTEFSLTWEISIVVANCHGVDGAAGGDWLRLLNKILD